MPKNFLCKSPKSFLQKNDPHPQTSLLAMPDQQDNAADYSPLLKRPRHSTGPNSSPLPCRQVFSSLRLFSCFPSMSHLSCAGNPPLKERDTTGNESASLGCGQRARNLSRRTSTRVGSCRTGTTRACSARPWRSGSRRGRSGRTARATQPAANERAARTR